MMSNNKSVAPESTGKSPEHSSFIIPLWLILLWASFAATILHSMAWLLEKTWLAALLGAIAAPWSYYAGSLLKSIELTSLALISVALGLAMSDVCMLVWHLVMLHISIHC